jgi:flagellar hook-basal body complex protein FliE
MKIEEIVVNAIPLPDLVNKTEIPASKTDFADWLDVKVTELNDKIIESDNMVRELALGEIENLHQVMMALEKTKMEFSMLVQVRNRLLEGYQQILRMQL